jgi:hypothetical protein
MVIDALSELDHDPHGDGEKPWCDLVLEIANTRSGVGGGSPEIAVDAVGAVPSGEIGFLAGVPSTDWTPLQVDTSDDAAVKIHWGKIWFCSTGAQTDRLLAVYEEWFGLPRTSPAVPGEIESTTAILGNDPQLPVKKKIYPRLFFDSAAQRAPERYAELFTNFDLPGRAWLEKDPEYREPLPGWPAGRNQQRVGC